MTTLKEILIATALILLLVCAYLAQQAIFFLQEVNVQQMKLNQAVHDTFAEQGKFNALVIEKLK